jgi:hypothetical protein
MYDVYWLVLMMMNSQRVLLVRWDQNSLCSNLEVAEGCDVGGDEVGDEWEPEKPITGPCDSVTVSEG